MLQTPCTDYNGICLQKKTPSKKPEDTINYRNC